MNLAIVLLSAGMGFASASAEQAPTFEESLGALEGTVRASREERAQVRYGDLALEIDRAARESSEAAWSVRYLRGGIAEVRRLSRGGYPDPSLGRTLERLLWDMDLWRERAASLASRVQRLAFLADRRDPRLRAPALSLADGSRAVEDEARLAAQEARDASAGLRRLGRRIEAESLERKAARMSDISRMLESEARRLLERVR